MCLSASRTSFPYLPTLQPAFGEDRVALPSSRKVLTQVVYGTASAFARSFAYSCNWNP
jgi:hypothetical protein